jgi:hypothetical protein
MATIWSMAEAAEARRQHMAFLRNPKGFDMNAEIEGEKKFIAQIFRNEDFDVLRQLQVALKELSKENRMAANRRIIRARIFIIDAQLDYIARLGKG